ncbi:HNH endonuclease [Humibacter sp.]|uniref:HNH endonuclease n=1 Tax=Humibacter sp. TaxID=1940291 RepID=UPI003F8176A6
MQSTEFTQQQLIGQAYVLERISRVQRVAGFDECWEWNLKLNRDGYGHGRFAGKGMSAYRASYLSFVGPVPRGLHLDHLCNNRACVNPAHLDPVTRVVNSKRAVERDRLNGTGHWAQREMCSKGLHAMTDDNVYLRDMGGRTKRLCAECVLEGGRRWRREHPERAAEINAANYIKQKARRAALKQSN